MNDPVGARLTPLQPAAAPAPTRRLGRLIVVFGTSTGVGKTSVAVNLAMGLAQRKHQVCLVDLDVDTMGGASAALRLQPAHALVGNNLQEAMVPHSSGVHLYAGALNARQVAQLDQATVARAMTSLRSRYDYLIVDGGKAFSGVLLAAFSLANLALLVTSPELAGRYQTKWAVGILESLHYPLRMMKVILNRLEGHSHTQAAGLHVALPCDIIAAIPTDSRLAAGSPAPIEAIKGLIDDLTTREWYLDDQQLQRARQANGSKLPKPSMPAWGLRGTAGEEQAAKDHETEELDEIAKLKQRIGAQLLETNLRAPAAGASAQAYLQLREKAEQLIANLLTRELGEAFNHPEVRTRLMKEIADEVLGLGPLEELLADPQVTDILINGKDLIYVERKGRLELTAKQFVSTNQLRAVIERIIAPLGRHVDESNPMVDARLPDGSRVSVVIPPLAVSGPQMSIRKFAHVQYTSSHLIANGSLSAPMAQFIEACVRFRKNVVISGGAGSGKTTLLNVISEFIPEDERIITIEDAAELRLSRTHWVSLEARPPNIEGKGEVSIRQLFRHALRMRPDRIIIGECRGAETLDMLQAMNTGHDGSLTTVHANAPRDVITRLDSMVLMSDVEMPVRAIREMIASAIDIIIHTARLSDGSRKITAITEVAGLATDTELALQDLFVFHQTGLEADGTVKGTFTAAGNRPTFLDELQVKGLNLDPAIFAP